MRGRAVQLLLSGVMVAVAAACSSSQAPVGAAREEYKASEAKPVQEVARPLAKAEMRPSSIKGFPPQAPAAQPPGAPTSGGGIVMENAFPNLPDFDQPPPARRSDFTTEEYQYLPENPFLSTVEAPLSTFSIDVDTAAYANVRRFLQQNQLPPKDAVRIEELVNYFDYEYPEPQGSEPFALNTELGAAPWNPEHRLLRVGLKAKNVDLSAMPPANLVFLIDVSGSMDNPNKLPLVKASLKLLVEQLRPQDRVSLVVYAGAAGLVLPATDGSDKPAIIEALDKLSAGGSTAGGRGIELAYKVAQENFLPEGNNRVILATDGDFNVGVSSSGDLVRLIEEKRKSGVFLTILGFGMGNYKDSRMEQLSNAGNGNYAYIDNLLEARKVLAEQLGGTLLTLAKDVKLQIEFNPAKVTAYRLLGYENRLLRDRDFTDDTKDAGELGAGHTVTVLYELKPATGNAVAGRELRYQATAVKGGAEQSEELAQIKYRYKEPRAQESKPGVQLVRDEVRSDHSADFRLAVAVVEWGLLLRDSEHKGRASFEQVAELLKGALGHDPNGYRHELARLVALSADLKRMEKR